MILRNHKAKKLFNFIYMSGILFGMVIVYGTFQKWSWAIEYSGLKLLTFSTSYILLLCFVAWTMIRKPRGRIIGARVQLAGYLYTLIGFIISVLSMDNSNFTIENLIFPLGTALVTSLLGWFFGGLLSDADEEQYIKTLGTESDRLAAEFADFASSAEIMHKKYLDTIKGAGEEFQMVLETAKVFNELLQPLSEILYELSESRLADSMKELSEDFEKLRKNVQKASEAAEGTATYLDQSKGLITGVEEFLQTINHNRYENGRS